MMAATKNYIKKWRFLARLRDLKGKRQQVMAFELRKEGYLSLCLLCLVGCGWFCLESPLSLLMIA